MWLTSPGSGQRNRSITEILVHFPLVEDVSGCYLRRYVARQTRIGVLRPCTSYVAILVVQFNLDSWKFLSQLHQSTNTCESRALIECVKKIK